MATPSSQHTTGATSSFGEAIGSGSVQPNASVSTTPSAPMQNTQKLLVDVDDKGSVYGVNANKWKTRVQHFFRANIPICYESWPKVDASFKDNMWKALMKEFYFSIADFKARPKVEKGFAQKYRTLKSKYRTFLKDTLEESIADVPDGIDPGVWKPFCMYEHNDKVIARNKKNGENKKHATPHCYGRRSFAQVIDSMVKENPGKRPRRVEVWKKGRIRVDGSILESARETYEKVVAADEKIISLGIVDVDDIEHDALSEVFGVDTKSCTRGVSSYTSLKQVRHDDFVRSLYEKDVLASNASVDEKIGKMESKIDSMEGVMKAVLEQVTLANMGSWCGNPPNATTPRTEVGSSSAVRHPITPTNLLNSFGQMLQSNTKQRVSLLNRGKKVVGEGFVDLETGNICHGREVVDGEVKVYVEKVFDGATPVYDGPQHGCETLSDIATGGYLMWLKARLRYD